MSSCLLEPILCYLNVLSTNDVDDVDDDDYFTIITPSMHIVEIRKYCLRFLLLLLTDDFKLNKYRLSWMNTQLALVHSFVIITNRFYP